MTEARRLPAAQARPRLDLRRLRDCSAMSEVTAPDGCGPVDLDALVTLDRWSIAVLDGLPHLMGVTDWGEVVAFDIDRLAKDRSWVRRRDGTYLRLLEPWALPCVRGGRT